MTRAKFDRLISTGGFVVAIVLLVMSGALFWGQNFIHTEVTEQLSSQKITFPAAGSEQINALPETDKTAVSKYAGQTLTTGAQAEAYANHYINAHLQNIGGGQTYAELSAASLANPSDQALAGKTQAMFKGETLRGLLLNAYAFDTMALVALVSAFVTAAGAVLMLVLSGLGFIHAGATKKR